MRRSTMCGKIEYEHFQVLDCIAASNTLGSITAFESHPPRPPRRRPPSRRLERRHQTTTTLTRPRARRKRRRRRRISRTHPTPTQGRAGPPSRTSSSCPRPRRDRPTPVGRRCTWRGVCSPSTSCRPRQRPPPAPPPSPRRSR